MLEVQLADKEPPVIEHDPDEKPSKYPRKVFFGLITDYGPPKQDGNFWIGWIIFAAVMYFANHGFPW